MDIAWKLLYYLMMTSTLIYGHLPTIELLEDRGTNALYCILRNETNSTAIMWEKSRIENIEVSQYLPNLFHCKIGKDEKCTKLLTTKAWRLDDSLNHNLDIVLDRRWETFRTIKTPKINFKVLPTPGISSINYTIDVFVKIRANAFIFLCDGHSPPDSNCYWITLIGWDGKESVIRKCEKGCIPSYEGVHPQGKCTSKKAINYHGYSNQPTGAKEWRFFTIILNNYTLTVLQSNQNFLTYPDPDKNLRVRHLIIASLMDSPGLWKIDNSTIIYRTGEPYLIHSFQNSMVKFSFSVRRTNAVDNLFLYLCEDDNVFNSTCYRVIFNDNGKNTVCKIGSGISFYHCLHSAETLWNDFGKTTYWHHFTFYKINDVFTFYQYWYEKVIEFNDSDFSVKYVFIGSEKMVYWKIHSYGVVTANSSGDTSISLFQARKNEDICIAVFVQINLGCNLTVSLIQDRTNILKSVTLEETNRWEELKLKAQVEKDVNLFLHISIITDQHQAYISDIRDCNENDRILELNATGLDKESLSCVSARYPEVKAKVKRNEMKNATIALRSDNSVDFTWTGTTKSRYFILKYRLLKYVSCKDNFPSKHVTIMNVTPTTFGALLNARLAGLAPYAIYTVTILNDIGNVIKSQNVQTWSQAAILYEELPSLDYEQDEFELEIHITVKDCQVIRGPLFYKIIVTGLDPWTKDFKTKPIIRPISLGITNHSFDILGYSNYNVSFEFSRNNSFDNIMREDIIVHTYPTVPISVSNVLAYSKTNTSVWLRWKEPFPPTGQLENYVIQYTDQTNHRKDKKVKKDSKCKIWPDFVCAELKELLPGENYTIYVRAKNKNVNQLGNYKAPVYVLTQLEEPHQPKQYKISWYDTFMIIELEHPDISNGPLRHIYVTINGKLSIFQVEEELRYYIVNAADFSATIVNVTLELVNLREKSSPLITRVASPPKSPKITGDNSFQILRSVVFLDPITLQDLDGTSEIFVLIPNYTHQHLEYECSELGYADIYLHMKLAQTRLDGDMQKLNITLKEKMLSSKYLKVIVIVIRNSFEGLFRCTEHKFLLRLEQTALISMGILLTLVTFMMFSATGFIVYRCIYNETGCS